MGRKKRSDQQIERKDLTPGPRFKRMIEKPFRSRTRVAMIDTDCRQASAAAESTALELFQMAALLLGDEAEAVAAVEQAVAQVKADPCSEPEAARLAAEEQLVGTAIRRVQQLSIESASGSRPDSKSGCQPGALTPPDGDVSVSEGCVDTDDLSAAGLTQAQLQEMLAHSDRAGLRHWLDGLAAGARVIFVLRAVLGRSSAQAANDLKGAGCGDWTTAQVGISFRGALCSLTSALLQAATV
jgi:DNA-directed RNA polymerase specialized sigma24 family protein